MNDIVEERGRGLAPGGWEAGPRRRADLIVEGTDVQGRVPRGVLGTRLSSIEKQMFQMLRMTPLAGLERTGGEEPGQTHLTTASVSLLHLEVRQPCIRHSPRLLL